MTEQNNREEGIPELCADAVLVVSEELPKDTPTVKGYLAVDTLMTPRGTGAPVFPSVVIPPLLVLLFFTF